MVSLMITQYIEKKIAGPIINKEMIIVFLSMFPPTYITIPLHNTFLNCNEKFTYEQEILLLIFPLKKYIRIRALIL